MTNILLSLILHSIQYDPIDFYSTTRRQCNQCDHLTIQISTITTSLTLYRVINVSSQNYVTVSERSERLFLYVVNSEQN